MLNNHSQFLYVYQSLTEGPTKAGICARDRRALQQLALIVHVKHSDLYVYHYRINFKIPQTFQNIYGCVKKIHIYRYFRNHSYISKFLKPIPLLMSLCGFLTEISCNCIGY